MEENKGVGVEDTNTTTEEDSEFGNDLMASPELDSVFWGDGLDDPDAIAFKELDVRSKLADPNFKPSSEEEAMKYVVPAARVLGNCTPQEYMKFYKTVDMSNKQYEGVISQEEGTWTYSAIWDALKKDAENIELLRNGMSMEDLPLYHAAKAAGKSLQEVQAMDDASFVRFIHGTNLWRNEYNQVLGESGSGSNMGAGVVFDFDKMQTIPESKILSQQQILPGELPTFDFFGKASEYTEDMKKSDERKISAVKEKIVKDLSDSKNELTAFNLRFMFAEDKQAADLWEKMTKDSNETNLLFFRSGSLDSEKVIRTLSEDMMSAKTSEERSEKFQRHQFLLSVLGNKDKRWGFRNNGDIVTRMFAGVGNYALDYYQAAKNVFQSDADRVFGEASKIAESAASEIGNDEYKKKYIEWLGGAVSAVNNGEVFDEKTFAAELVSPLLDSAVSMGGFGRAFKILSLSNMMKATGGAMKLTGGAMKVAHLGKAGTAVANAGGKVTHTARQIGGYTVHLDKAGKIVNPTGIKRVIHDINPFANKIRYGNVFQRQKALCDKLAKSVSAAQELSQDVSKQAWGINTLVGSASERYALRQLQVTKFKQIAELDNQIAAMESHLSKVKGFNYGAVKSGCMTIADKLPALAFSFKSTLAEKNANERYVLGQKMGNNFIPEMMETSDFINVLDSAGNTLFLMGISECAMSAWKNASGGKALQEACETVFGGAKRAALQAGNHEVAWAFRHALDLAYAKSMREACVKAMLDGAGMGMSATAFDKFRNNEVNNSIIKFKTGTEKDFLSTGVTFDDAKNVAKQAFEFGVGTAVGVGVGGARNFAKIYGDARKAKKMFDADSVTQMQTLMAAAINHRVGHTVIDVNNVRDKNPAIINKRINEQLTKDRAMYDNVSKDVADFIMDFEKVQSYYGTSEYKTRSEEFRQRVRSAYGEQFARVFDEYAHTFKNRGQMFDNAVAQNAMRFTEEQIGSRKNTELVRIAFGSDARIVNNDDGTYRIEYDFDGKKFNKSVNLSRWRAKTHEISEGKFEEGWASELVDNILNDKEGFERSGMKEKLTALGEDAIAQLKKGNDVGGFLKAANENKDIQTPGKYDPSTNTIGLDASRDNLSIDTVTEEFMHAAVEQMIRDGRINTEDLSMLTEATGLSGKELMEFVAKQMRNAVNGDVYKGLEREVATKYDLHYGDVFDKLAALSTMAKSALKRLDYALNEQKPVESGKSRHEREFKRLVDAAKDIIDQRKQEEEQELIRKEMAAKLREETLQKQEAEEKAKTERQKADEALVEAALRKKRLEKEREKLAKKMRNKQKGKENAKDIAKFRDDFKKGIEELSAARQAERDAFEAEIDAMENEILGLIFPDASAAQGSEENQKRIDDEIEAKAKATAWANFVEWQKNWLEDAEIDAELDAMEKRLAIPNFDETLTDRELSNMKVNAIHIENGDTVSAKSVYAGCKTREQRRKRSNEMYAAGYVYDKKTKSFVSRKSSEATFQSIVTKDAVKKTEAAVKVVKDIQDKIEKKDWAELARKNLIEMWGGAGRWNVNMDGSKKLDPNEQKRADFMRQVAAGWKAFEQYAKELNSKRDAARLGGTSKHERIVRRGMRKEELAAAAKRISEITKENEQKELRDALEKAKDIARQCAEHEKNAPKIEALIQATKGKKELRANMGVLRDMDGNAVAIIDKNTDEVITDKGRFKTIDFDFPMPSYIGPYSKTNKGSFDSEAFARSQEMEPTYAKEFSDGVKAAVESVRLAKEQQKKALEKAKSLFKKIVPDMFTAAEKDAMKIVRSPEGYPLSVLLTKDKLYNDGDVITPQDMVDFDKAFPNGSTIEPYSRDGFNEALYNVVFGYGGAVSYRYAKGGSQYFKNRFDDAMNEIVEHQKSEFQKGNKDYNVWKDDLFKYNIANKYHVTMSEIDNALKSEMSIFGSLNSFSKLYNRLLDGEKLTLEEVAKDNSRIKRFIMMYNDLRDVEISIGVPDSGAMASFYPNEKKIVLSKDYMMERDSPMYEWSLREAKDSIEHEMTHTVQFMEGYGLGSGESWFHDGLVEDSARDAVINMAIDSMNYLLDERLEMDSELTQEDISSIRHEGQAKILSLMERSSTDFTGKCQKKDNLPSVLKSINNFIREFDPDHEDVEYIFDAIKRYGHESVFYPQELYMLTSGEAEARAMARRCKTDTKYFPYFYESYDVPEQLLLNNEDVNRIQMLIPTDGPVPFEDSKMPLGNGMYKTISKDGVVSIHKEPELSDSLFSVVFGNEFDKFAGGFDARQRLLQSIGDSFKLHGFDFRRVKSEVDGGDIFFYQNLIDKDRKPQVPKAFLERSKNEQFTVSDFVGNFLKKDVVLPDNILNAKVRVIDKTEKRVKELGNGKSEVVEYGVPRTEKEVQVSLPLFQGDDFIMANSDGEIVIDAKRWKDADKAKVKPAEQFARAVVDLQRNGSVEKNPKTSAIGATEATSPSRMKRSNSRLAYWLQDKRFFDAGNVGVLVDNALHRHFGNTTVGVTDDIRKRVSNAIKKELDNAINHFAAQIETEALAAGYGSTLDEMVKAYEERRAEMKKGLKPIESKNTTSAKETANVIAFWDEVVMKAVDAALFGKDAGKSNSKTLREDFRAVVAEQITNDIVRNIIENGRKARTKTEAKLAGTEVGDTPNAQAKTKAEKLADVGVNTAESSYEDAGVSDELADARREAWANDDMEGGYENGTITQVVTKEQAEAEIDRQLSTDAVATDKKWQANKSKAAKAIKKLTEDFKKRIMSDPSLMAKAAELQAELGDKMNEIILANSNANPKDYDVVDSMKHEALSMMADSQYNVIYSKPREEDYVAEAAAARLSRELTKVGSKEGFEKRTLDFIMQSAKKIGVDEARLPQFVSDTYSDALSIATQVRNRLGKLADDTTVAAEVHSAARRRRITNDIMRGFTKGYDIGQRGEYATEAAVKEAARIQRRQMKEASGFSLGEVDSMVGMDTVNELWTLASGEGKYTDSDEFAAKFISSFTNRLKVSDSRFSGIDSDTITNDMRARSELAATVSNWMRRTADELTYGRVREEAIRAAARISTSEPPTFGSLHDTLRLHADKMANAMSKFKMSDLLDLIDKSIDDYVKTPSKTDERTHAYAAKLGPEEREYYKQVKAAMRMTQEAVDKELVKLQSKLDALDADAIKYAKDNGLDETEIQNASAKLAERCKIMRSMRALQQYGALKHSTFGDAKRVWENNLSLDMAGASTSWERIQKERIAADKQINDALISELDSYRKSKFGEFDNRVDEGNFLAMNVPDLFRRMQLYFNEGSEAYEIVEQLRREFSLGHIKETTYVSGWEGHLRDAVKSIYGKNFESVIRDLMVTKAEYDEFSRSGWYIPDGSDVAVKGDGTVKTNLPNHLSKANLIYIWAACQQKDMAENNRIWGRDDVYLKKIEGIIGIEGMRLARWLTSSYAKIREDISPISEEITGMKVLSPDLQYCPLAFEQDRVSVDSNRFSNSPFPSFLARRQSHSLARLDEKQDAFRMFENKIQDAGHYIAFGRLVDRVNTTLKDGKVQTAFEQLYGRKAKTDIYLQLSEALDGGKRNAEDLLNGARNFITATSLFGNVGSAIKQLEGFGGWSVEMGVGKWLKSIAVNPMTSAEVMDGMRELCEAGLFKTRDKEGISEAMVSLLQYVDGKDKGKFSRAMKSYMKNGMWLTKKIDILASMSMAAQYYTGRVKFFTSKGIEMEEAKRRALADTDYAIQTTQQSGRTEFLHRAQRGGMGGKVLTQFSGPSLVRWGIELESLHRAAVLGDKNAWRTLASRLVALHVICPAILTSAGFVSSWMFSNDPDNDEELYEKTMKQYCISALSGGMSGWFIWGSMVNYGANKVIMPDIRTNGSGSNLNAPMLSKLESGMNITSDLFNEVKDAFPLESVDDLMTEEIAEESVKFINWLFPVTRTLNAVKRIQTYD